MDGREKYLRRFFEQNVELPGLIRRALDGVPDATAIERLTFVVHKMQGTAAQLGVVPLRVLGLALERALRGADDARSFLHGHAPVLTDVADTLEALLVSPGSEQLAQRARELARELEHLAPRQSEVVLIDQGRKPMATTKIS